MFLEKLSELSLYSEPTIVVQKSKSNLLSRIKTGSSSASNTGYLDADPYDEVFPGMKGHGVLNSFGFSSLESQLEAKRKEKAAKAAQERKAKSYFDSIASTLSSWW